MDPLTRKLVETINGIVNEVYLGDEDARRAYAKARGQEYRPHNPNAELVPPKLYPAEIETTRREMEIYPWKPGPRPDPYKPHNPNAKIIKPQPVPGKTPYDDRAGTDNETTPKPIIPVNPKPSPWIKPDYKPDYKPLTPEQLDRLKSLKRYEPDNKRGWYNQ